MSDKESSPLFSDPLWTVMFFVFWCVVVLGVACVGVLALWGLLS